jgi:hypothetical protein
VVHPSLKNARISAKPDTKSDAKVGTKSGGAQSGKKAST